MKILKRVLVLLMCAATLLSMTACANDDDSNGNAQGDSTPTVITAYMTIKDYGNITIELYPEYAPQSVYNFVHLAKIGYYDGIVFHRIVKDFVIQAGAYEAGYKVRKMNPEYTILGEFSDNGVENGLAHARGVISWARRSIGEDPMNSASSQFFICLNDTTAASLDNSYAAFGKVVEGMDVVDAVAAVTCNGEIPSEEITITSVTVDGVELPEPDYIFPAE